MNKNKLDKYEKELLDVYEKGEFGPVENKDKRMSELQKAAQNTLRKDRRVNIRISGKDLTEIRIAAIKEGIPYQTLMSSVLHKFVGNYFSKKKHSTSK